MVSLGSHSRNSSQGGLFFDSGGESSGSVNDHEDGMLQPRLTETEQTFKPVRSAWLSALLLVFVLCECAAAVVLPLKCPHRHTCYEPPESLLLYSAALLWCIAALVDACLHRQHKAARIRGYLDFYRKTVHLRRLPLLLISAGNTALCVVYPVTLDHCVGTEDEECTSGLPHVRRVHYLSAVILLQTLALLPVLIMYLVRVAQHNRRMAAPDVQRDEMVTSLLHSTANTSDIGVRDDDQLEITLEAQADTIRYLQQHNQQLGRRLLILTQQLNAARAGLD